MFRHQPVCNFANAKNLTRVKINICCLTRESAHRRLMDEDSRIRQCKTLALGSGHEKKGSHACRLANAIRHDVILDELHCVINCQTCSDRSARGVDTVSYTHLT